MSKLSPVVAYQRWLAGQVIAASARIDRCRLHLDAWEYRRARRAELCWDADRKVEAEKLAAGLSKRPSLVAAQLRHVITQSP